MGNNETAMIVPLRLQAIGKKHCRITLGKAEYECAYPEGMVEVDLYETRIFSGHDPIAQLVNKLQFMAKEKGFEYARLMKYFANARQIRTRQLAEMLGVPAYVAKMIVYECMGLDALTQEGYSFRKSASFASALINFEVTPDKTRIVFKPVKERIAHTMTDDEEAWERWIENPDGLDLMKIERERIEESTLLTKSKKKAYLAVADKWIHVKKRYDKDTQPRKSEKERIQEIIEEDARESAAFDAEDAKKGKKVPEYSDDHEEEHDAGQPSHIRDDGFRLKDAEIDRRRKLRKQRRKQRR